MYLKHPHTLFLGRAGSGKTAALRAEAASALRKGEEVVLVEAFEDPAWTDIAPWITRMSQHDTAAPLEKALEPILSEISRRNAILDREEAYFWSELSPEIRTAEGIHPVLVGVVHENFMDGAGEFQETLMRAVRNARGSGIRLVAASHSVGIALAMLRETMNVVELPKIERTDHLREELERLGVPRAQGSLMPA